MSTADLVSDAIQPAEPSGASGRRSGALALEIALWLLAAGFVATTVYGVWNSYSPVPQYDSWNGIIEFQRKSESNLLGALWAPHNEHHIVVSNVVFWINNTFFGGRLANLIVLNVSLAAAIAVTLAVLVRKMVEGPRLARTALAVAAVIASFSWLAKENLVWEFQSCFLFVTLFTLLSFSLAARTRSSPRPLLAGVAAIALGVLAAISLGGGILTPVVLVALLVVLRAPWRLVFAAAVVAVAIDAALLVGYSGHPGAPSILGSWSSMMAGGRYVLAFVGAPLAYFTNSVVAAEIAGAVFVGLVLLAAGSLVRRGRDRGWEWAALAYCIFVVGNAGLAAMGRAFAFGLEGALPSRYQTMVLPSWVLLIALGVCALRRRRPDWTSAGAVVLLLAFTIVLMPVQAMAIQPVRQRPINDPQVTLREELNIFFGSPVARMSPALGLELGVRAPLGNKGLAPFPEQLPQLTDYARGAGLAAFGDELHGLREMLGTSSEALVSVPCSVQIIEVKPLPADKGWAQVIGAAYDSEGGGPPPLVEFRDPAGRIVGFAASWPLSAKKAQQTVGAPPDAGFLGYVTAASAATPLTARCTQWSK